MTIEDRTPDTASAAGVPDREPPRVVVWVLLIVAVAANAGVSLFSLPIALGVVSGLVALALGVLLARDHYRRRARSAR